VDPRRAREDAVARAGAGAGRAHGILGEESDLMSAFSATFDRPTTPDDDVLVVVGGKIAPPQRRGTIRPL
jgi:hypothetical protein